MYGLNDKILLNSKHFDINKYTLYNNENDKFKNNMFKKYKNFQKDTFKYQKKKQKEIKILKNKIKNTKLDLLIDDIYNKNNNKIRNYSFNTIYTKNFERKYDKIPILQKQLIKDYLIETSNKNYKSDENININNENKLPILINNNKYNDVYKIKFIDLNNNCYLEQPKIYNFSQYNKKINNFPYKKLIFSYNLNK